MFYNMGSNIEINSIQKNILPKKYRFIIRTRDRNPHTGIEM